MAKLAARTPAQGARAGRGATALCREIAARNTDFHRQAPRAEGGTPVALTLDQPGSPELTTKVENKP
ncbi:hypothetical protein WME89_40520 [Sorangium sp. So ce321]|uniref:hypothetical protein n=1 Tax=Sorangium sp. So ce321 TaxID=3133300 RepID=UPI003F5F04BE